MPSLVCLLEHGPGIDIFTPGKPGEYDLEGGIWEDEDARNFYENLVDLKAFVPAILFKDNDKSGQAKERDEVKGVCVCQTFCLCVCVFNALTIFMCRYQDFASYPCVTFKVPLPHSFCYLSRSCLGTK